MAENLPQQNTSGGNEIQTESTLFAEPITHIGNFTITNSLLSSWATVVILVILSVSVGKKIKKIPKGLQNIFELVIEQALELADSVTGDRKKTEKYF